MSSCNTHYNEFNYNLFILGIIGTLEEFKSPENIVLTNRSINIRTDNSYPSNFSEGNKSFYLYCYNSSLKAERVLVRVSPLNLTGWNYISIYLGSDNVRPDTTFKVYAGVSNNPNLTSFSFNSSYVNSFTGNMPYITPMINVSSLSGVYYLFCGTEITYGNHKDNYNVRFSNMQLTTQ